MSRWLPTRPADGSPTRPGGNGAGNGAEAAPSAYPHLYRRIGRFMLGFAPSLGVAIGLALITSLAFALLPWPIRYLIDGVLLSEQLDLGPLGVHPTDTPEAKVRLGLGLAGAYLALQVVAAVTASASFYAFARTALLMIHTLRGRMLTHLRSLSLSYHTTTSTGDMIYRAMNDARAIQEVMIFGVQAWILPLFQLTVMVILMIALDWVLAVAALILAPVLVVTVRALTGRIQRASHASRTHLGQLTSIIEQTLGSIRAVQVFGVEGDEAGRFDDTSHRFMGAQLRFRMAEQTLSVTTMALTGLGTALVLYVATNRVIDGVITVGAVWIFLAYMQRIYEVLQQNMNLFGLLQDALVGVGRAFQVLDTPPTIIDRPGASRARPLTRALALDAVSLRYPGADRDALHQVSLTVNRGERVALVGATGSGKTSVLNLIPRLHDPTGGAVRLDGVDLRDLQLTSVRDQISLVPQEALLFSTTVKENILYGRRRATDDEVEGAARAAQAHEFITDLPQGYDTEIGDRGSALSVGQQQRLALARAFLKNAPILLLDEPTSALDLATEADLIRGLDALMADRTVVIVAHRLSTIRSVDRIYVLDQGRVVEHGTHDELVGSGGHYHRLHQHQLAT